MHRCAFKKDMGLQERRFCINHPDPRWITHPRDTSVLGREEQDRSHRKLVDDHQSGLKFKQPGEFQMFKENLK